MRGGPLLLAAFLAAPGCAAGPEADAARPAAAAPAPSGRQEAAGGAGASPAGEVGSAGGGTLPLRVGEAGLQPLAFASEMALLFPEESAEAARGLLRAEFARREGRRLGLEADPAELQSSLASLAADLGEGDAPQTWAQARFGRPWTEVRAAYAERLAVNQLYQLVLRADAYAQGRLRLRWYLTAEEADAQAVLQRLRLGADPLGVLATTLQPNAPDELVPLYLPPPAAALLGAAEPGALVGPFRFAGDRVWRVALLLERLPAEPVPDRSALLAELRARPVSAVEARAWFEEMSRRYTASIGPLPISSPPPAF